MTQLSDDVFMFSTAEAQAVAVFSTPAAKVFHEAGEISPISLPDSDIRYMPWGADNMMPFRVMALIDADEVMKVCMDVCTEALFAGGLTYVSRRDQEKDLPPDVEDFTLDSNLDEYFLGVATDFRHFGFAVSVIDLSVDRKHIVRISRREACYCRFAEAQAKGHIPAVIYANWRNESSPQDIEVLPLLDPCGPYSDLRRRLEGGDKSSRFAIVSRMPTADSCYYPVPSYASLFRGRWYDIKRSIGEAKAAKLKNSSVIKYHIEVSAKYWESKFRENNVTLPDAKRALMRRLKQEIVDYLSGAENAGKAIFSNIYVDPNGKEIPEIKITKVDDSKEGGDWSVDIQEAVNMICFTMRVHSNLVGSVPGKSQSNNSGSDKRELYTIAQCQAEPLRRILMLPHKIICRFNGWKDIRPSCSVLQLTTLDEHKDLKKAST